MRVNGTFPLGSMTHSHAGQWHIPFRVNDTFFPELMTHSHASQWHILARSENRQLTALHIRWFVVFTRLLFTPIFLKHSFSFVKKRCRCSRGIRRCLVSTATTCR